MTRRFTEPKLVVASHNAGKVREIRELLTRFPVEVVSAGDLQLPEPDETGATFVENAALKAHTAARGAKLPALADDSGICVDGLGGDPGIYSARWAGPGKDFSVAMGRIEQELGGNPNRHARFVCALALAWPDGECVHFVGQIAGNLVFPPRGDRGFGYDPIFIPDGYKQTFAEITPEEKNAVSHRARAFGQLVTECFR